METIEVKNLVKVFNGVRAVDDISFDVSEGEIFGLLGPNGAGKTTTTLILATLLKPTSGEARVAGYDVAKEPAKVRRHIGVVFQETTLDLDLTARENLDFHARLYGLSKLERERRIREALELVDLHDKADVVVKKFSGGMKRKLEIARGLIHFPAVLFLDEPTTGLDAHTRRRIWKYILDAKGDTTVVLTTHYIEEAEKLCDRVAVMNRGRIIALDKPGNLIKAVGRDVIILEGENLEKLAEKIDFRFALEGDKMRIYVERGDEILPEIIELSSSVGTKIRSAIIRRPSLEDVFIQLTVRPVRQ
jgi:ABC-2 type transport system ATP-binding protein